MEYGVIKINKTINTIFFVLLYQWVQTLQGALGYYLTEVSVWK